MSTCKYQNQVEKWDVFEVEVFGKKEGNPFADYTIEGVFSGKEETKTVDGFYDGDGVYRVRFMPSFEGTYTFKISGSFSEESFEGCFQVTAPSKENHGPVRVSHTYHFAYEEDNPCYEEICHSPKQIKEHFSYIKDNNFFTPKMNELEMYIDQKVQLPQKSVVITFDDGTRADVAKKYVDEYKINATLFLITSWFNKEQFESEYFEVHSHGDNIHNGGLCSGGQGGEIKCMEHDKLLTDLKTSRDKLNGSTVFCYPFYEYNDYSIKVLKEAGFTMAFAGERAGGKIKVTPGIDKFRLPRWVIVNYTTQTQFISYVNGGS